MFDHIVLMMLKNELNIDTTYHHTRTENSIISVVLVRNPWNKAIRFLKSTGLKGNWLVRYAEKNFVWIRLKIMDFFHRVISRQKLGYGMVCMLKKLGFESVRSCLYEVLIGSKLILS